MDLQSINIFNPMCFTREDTLRTCFRVSIQFITRTNDLDPSLRSRGAINRASKEKEIAIIRSRAPPNHGAVGYRRAIEVTGFYARKGTNGASAT